MKCYSLFQMDNSNRGTMCNRAIMIITDGAPETFEDIFQKYNWPEKHVSSLKKIVTRLIFAESFSFSAKES